MSFFYNKRILIISPEPWGINFLSKHHYAKVLAKRGNEVFFLNPAWNESSRGIEVEDVEGSPNLKVVGYGSLFRGLNRMPQFLADVLSKIEIVRLSKIWRNRLDIVWSFDPFRFQELKYFGAPLKIYHAVDVHQTNREKKIASAADIVFATSDKILQQVETNKPKFNVGHGLAGHFTKTEMWPFVQPESERIKVGYIGNLHYRFLATDTVTQIIKDHPDIDFVFIGPLSESNLSGTTRNSAFIDFLRSSPNVYLTGAIASEELPQYMARFDMFMLCYEGDKHLTELSNPHKILEYLSTGRIVISSYIDEYKNKRHLLEMADATSELPELFTKVVSNLGHYNSNEKMKLRIDYAVSNTYVNQLIKIEIFLSQL